MTDQLRWKQRSQNFEKAFIRLKEAVINADNLSDLEKEGLVQRFEYTLELAWKTLKDYLSFQGVDAKFPREVIKESFAADLIEDGEIWMDMLEKRNLMSHTYEESIFLETVDNIKTIYFDEILKLYNYLKAL